MKKLVGPALAGLAFSVIVYVLISTVEIAGERYEEASRYREPLGLASAGH